MNATDKSSVCVIIAAWNAMSTIERAINSALAQSEVSEIIVIDDCSTDDTVNVAMAADDGSGRLRVLTQPANRGPAAARNRAIAESRAPILAILDSDDFFLPGRFSALLETPGWTAIADNLVFIQESRSGSFAPETVRSFDAEVESISLADFINSNVTQRGQSRGELGFAKPLLRRDFLEKHDLAYDESLRLGEDYALYARVIAAGGTFLKVRRCGYVAVERAQSLSGQHDTADLEALLISDKHLAALPMLDEAAREAIARHIGQLTDKVWLRQILDRKRSSGSLKALAAAASRPSLLPQLMSSVLRDKLSLGQAPRSMEARYLFS